MKKFHILMVILLFIVSPLLFSLDIYLNDILWHSYSSSDLHDLKVELSLGIEEKQGIPLAEILPLMNSLEGMRISIPDGDILLSETLSTLRTAKLLSTGEGVSDSWQLSMNNSLYFNPYRIELYGTAFPRKNLLLWAEPGLAGMKEQSEVWSSLHKVNIEYREVQNIRTELIHREMTGDLLPDFILVFLDSREALEEDRTCAYVLQSALVPQGTDKADSLVLPSGNRVHPDLFMSILAAQTDRESPFDPLFKTDTESLNRASRAYLDQILNRNLMEQDDFSLSETYRIRELSFFPARAFPQQKGHLSSLPVLSGMENPPAARVFPLKLEVTGRGIPEGALLDFLKLPGVQYHLFSLEKRQLPSDMQALETRTLNDAEDDLYRDWQRGFILNALNSPFSEAVLKRLPDIIRHEEDLIP
ncbi:hypothetical protein EXM22_11860 [Oceanispirochaeta crateris]|uniref:Uncharacterized protein n=2 Tax=Oceanispirochaeta crateris TaxID=2518645 RepID=A0A5C1QMB2_9SPIO|nr:hypothetical protein EXM22_11860 [Oceanispirochaeta crateris]